MQLSHRPGSLQSSLRQWVSSSEDWLGGTLRNMVVADVRRVTDAGRGIAVRAVNAPIERSLTVATDSAIQSEVAHLALIYSAERRLQLAHAINDRENIRLIRAELDQLL